MDGPEFSIDLLCDLDGRCLNAIPRTMLESRGGESIKGAAIADPELIDLGRAVAEALPLRGPATVQVFRDPEIGLGITDVNARFGGAFACPMYAALPGPHLPRADRPDGARASTIEPHVGEFLAGPHVHALLLADRARRGAAARPAATSCRTARGRRAEAHALRLITIAGLIAVLALLDVVVTAPDGARRRRRGRVARPTRHFPRGPT